MEDDGGYAPAAIAPAAAAAPIAAAGGGGAGPARSATHSGALGGGSSAAAAQVKREAAVKARLNTLYSLVHSLSGRIRKAFARHSQDARLDSSLLVRLAGRARGVH